MYPASVSSPNAGNTLPTELNSWKSATTARNCGNIWISSRVSSPPRRPRKRNRENA